MNRYYVLISGVVDVIGYLEVEADNEDDARTIAESFDLAKIRVNDLKDLDITSNIGDAEIEEIGEM